MIAEFCWVSCGSLGTGGSIEENRVVSDRKNTGELVGDDYDGRAETVAEAQDEVVETARAERIESGTGLVEEEDFRIERHGAGDAGAFVHAAADLGGIVVLVAREADEGELIGNELADGLGRQSGVFFQRHGDVLGKRHGGPQCAGLIHHAKAADEFLPFHRTGGGEILVAIENAALDGFQQADEVAQQRALAAAAAAHDDKNVLLGDLEIEIPHDHEGVISHRQIADRDLGLGRGIFRRSDHRLDIEHGENGGES